MSTEAVDRLHVLRNAGGMVVTISARGAALQSWLAADRYGKLGEVLAGPGEAGDALWEGEPGADGLHLRHANASVHYRLGEDGSLRIEVEAPASSAPRPRFKLCGGDVGDHLLTIEADDYWERDQAGRMLRCVSVAGTAFDFRSSAAIGARLVWPDAQIKLAGGFDHCFRVAPAQGAAGVGLRPVARVLDLASGRELQVLTSAPILHFFSGGGRGLSFAALAADISPAQPVRQTTVYRLGLQL